MGIITVLNKRGTFSNLKKGQYTKGELVISLDTQELYMATESNKLTLCGSILIGNSSLKPNYGVPGRMFFNSDLSTIEIDTGTDWVSVTGAGGLEDAPNDGNKYIRQNGNWVKMSDINYGTEDLEPGVSELADGELYIVYE